MCLTVETGSSPITIRNFCDSEFSMSLNFFLPPMRRFCVLATLRDNLFDSNQVFKETRSELTLSLMVGNNDTYSLQSNLVIGVGR